MNCKDCKWWEKKAYTLNPEWGECELTKTEDEKQLHKESMAATYDGEWFPNALECSPDFGCVQFEVKNEL